MNTAWDGQTECVTDKAIYRGGCPLNIGNILHLIILLCLPRGVFLTHRVEKLKGIVCLFMVHTEQAVEDACWQMQ